MPSLSAPLPDGAAAWRTRNPGALMFAATGAFVADKLRLVAACGQVVSPAQATLFQHVDIDGTRPSVIAARAGLTRSSVTELIARLERVGILERRGDPADARATTIAFTPAGLMLLDHLRRGVIGAERRMAVRIGRPFVTEMKWRLADYAATATPDRYQPMAAGNATWRIWSVGRVLVSAGDLFMRDVLQVMHARGFAAVTEADTRLIRHLDGEGTRLTDLAARARVTKQSMVELVHRAERIGLVRRHADPTDGRAKMVAFTPTGHEALESARHGVLAARRRLVDATDASFPERLVAGLVRYVTGTDAAWFRA